MFHLKTEIERKLYIQALLQCLERGTLTAEELLNDFNTIILTIARAGIIEDRRLQRRIEGILAAYKCHAIDLDEASTGVLSIFDELKASPSIFDAAPYLTSASA